MKIKELIQETPEMTEEKLLKLMGEHLEMFPKYLRKRILDIHYKKPDPLDPITKYILKEFDLIQEKKSYLTKSQRNQVQGFVGMCLIKMTKGEEKKDNSEYTEYEEINNGTAGE